MAPYDGRYFVVYQYFFSEAVFHFDLVGVHVDVAQTMRMLSLKVVCFSTEFLCVCFAFGADPVAIRYPVAAPQNI